MNLQGKVAIVTGADSGIGKAIAHRFARDGANVVVDYGSKADQAHEVVAALEAIGAKAFAIQCDVSDPEQVETLISETVEKFGRLDILVNNAGIEKKSKFVDMPEADWHEIIAVNLTGPVLASQAAAKQMIAQGGDGGRIINISSVHEDLPMITNSAYCAAKGGLRMLMRTIAVELAPHKILVNNIAPGAVFTPIDAGVENDPALMKQLLAEIPLERMGRPDEIAEMAAFLASDAASYSTGSTFFVDGGMIRQAGSL